MNLTTEPRTAPTTPLAAAPAGAHGLKWMWVAIGVLGTSVLALGATLVLQQRPPSASAAEAAQVAQTSPAPRTPESQIIDEKRPVALMQPAQAAIKSIATYRQTTIDG